MIRVLFAIDRVVERFTFYALVVAVFAMLTFSVLTIVFRWFQITCLWFEPLVRHLVFSSTFLGGVIATGRGTHISIDIVGRYLENSGSKHRRIWLARTVALCCVLVLGWLIYASWKFVQVELQYGKEVFWGLHSGFLVAVIPVGFGLIGYRFLYRLARTFSLSKKK